MDLPPLSYEPRGRKRSRKSHGDYTVACLCPLAVELTPMSAMLDAIHEDLPTHTDHNAYVLGELGEHNIVLVTPPSTGNSNSGIAITQLKHDFPSIRIGLLVGVGGGVPGSNGTNDVRLGDVVVGEPTGTYSGVVQFDMGKNHSNGEFETTGCLNKPPPLLASAVKKTKAQHQREGNHIQSLIMDMLRRNPGLSKDFSQPNQDSDRLFEADYQHREGDSCDGCNPGKVVRRSTRQDQQPQIHYGTIGSSNAVIKNAIEREKLRAKYNLLCVEMEAAGFLDSFACLVVRGICDYADSHKNKIWQPYAAAAAAAYAKELLLNVAPIRQYDDYLPSQTSVEQEDNSMLVRIDTQTTLRSTFTDLASQQLNDNTSRQDTYKALFKTLKFRRMDARLHNIDDALLSTCKWLYAHESYRQWNDDQQFVQHHGFLWIKGKPGSGKSTMMKATMLSMKKQRINEVFLSYFFNARAPDELEKSSLGLYRSLVFQTLQALPHIQDYFIERFAAKEKEGIVEEWTTTELQGFLLYVVGILHDHPLNIFIDALDEGNDIDVRRLVAFLEDLAMSARSSGSPLRICLSSRHYPHISIRKGLSLRMESELGQANDIRMYVEQRLVHDDSIEISNLRSQICEKADGVFLWVFLVVPMLNAIYDRGAGIDAMIRCFEGIPGELEGLFAAILSRDPDEIDDCVSLLRWILFAKGSLSPAELYLAIKARSQKSNHHDKDLPNEATLSRYLLNCSKGLAEVTRSEPPVVQFIHETVRSFLVQDRGLGQFNEYPGGDVVGLGHDQLKASCLQYLSSYPVLSDHILSNREYVWGTSDGSPSEPSLSFLKYAVNHVFWHAAVAEEKFCTQKTFLDNLQNIEHNKFTTWRLFHNGLQKYNTRKYSPEATLLYVLVEMNLYSLVKALACNKSLLDIPGERYGNALQAACAAGHERIAQLLIENGASVHTEAGEHQHSLCAAIHSKSESIIRLLLRHGAKPSKEILKRRLFVTISRGYVLGVEVLLDLGVSIECYNSSRKTPLALAASKGKAAVVELLLQKKADVNARFRDHETPLMVACHGGDKALVKMLLEYEADINAQSLSGFTALMRACAQAHKEVVQILLEHGADVGAENIYGSTALIKACTTGDGSVVQTLLEHGADVGAENNFGSTALIKACTTGDGSVVQILLKHGAIIDAQSHNGETALFVACANDREATVQTLLEHGANPNAVNKDGLSVLMKACRYGREGVLKLLFEYGADVHTLSGDSTTALVQACLSNHRVMMQVLVENGVDVNAVDQHGDSVLMHACCTYDEAVVRLLLKHGADVNAVDPYGKSALMKACRSGQRQAALILLDHGADIDARDQHGKTALWHACVCGDEVMAEMLIKHNADVNVRDLTFESALDVAKQCKHEHIADLLIANGARTADDLRYGRS